MEKSVRCENINGTAIPMVDIWLPQLCQVSHLSSFNHPWTLTTMNDLAVVYKEQGQFDEAEPLLLEAVEGRHLKLGDTHPHTLESWHNLIDLYEA